MTVEALAQGILELALLPTRFLLRIAIARCVPTLSRSSRHTRIRLQDVVLCPCQGLRRIP